MGAFMTLNSDLYDVKKY